MYHSTTLLLPDGRVLAAGGDNFPSGEIYVVLLRLSSVTHSNNMGQRLVQLAALSGLPGTYAVPGPADANQAPPGHYMLFVVDDQDVPSEARIVRVGGLQFDCNQNGVEDSEDIATGTSLDLDAGGVPDECQDLSADAAALSVSAGRDRAGWSPGERPCPYPGPRERHSIAVTGLSGFGPARSGTTLVTSIAPRSSMARRSRQRFRL